MKSAWIRLGMSFVYASRGITRLFQKERNARIHLVLALVAVIVAWHLGLSMVEWGLLALTIGMVFVAEAMNTAIESLTDLANPEFHPLAKDAKDIAAGAVLMAALVALLMAMLLFLPKMRAW